MKTKKYDLFEKDGNYILALEPYMLGGQWHGEKVITPKMPKQKKIDIVLDLVSEHGERDCYTRVLKELE